MVKIVQNIGLCLVENVSLRLEEQAFPSREHFIICIKTHSGSLYCERNIWCTMDHQSLNLLKANLINLSLDDYVK